MDHDSNQGIKELLARYENLGNSPHISMTPVFPHSQLALITEDLSYHGPRENIVALVKSYQQNEKNNIHHMLILYDQIIYRTDSFGIEVVAFEKIESISFEEKVDQPSIKINETILLHFEDIESSIIQSLSSFIEELVNLYYLHRDAAENKHHYLHPADARYIQSKMGNEAPDVYDKLFSKGKQQRINPGERIEKGWCPNCDDTIIKTTGLGYHPTSTSIVLHIILSVCTGGSWLVIWFAIALFAHLSKGTSVCTKCGQVIQA